MNYGLDLSDRILQGRKKKSMLKHGLRGAREIYLSDGNREPTNGRGSTRESVMEC